MVMEMNETTRKRAAIVFLVGLAVVALYLCYLIAKPFLGPVLIAVMLAIVFYPLQTRIERYFRRPSVAAAISTIIVLLFVTIPVVLLGISVSRELRTVVQTLREQSWLQGGMTPYLAKLGESLLRRLANFVDPSQLDPHAALLRWAEQASRYLFSASAAVVANVSSFVLDSVVVFFSLFFFFREGRSIRQGLSAMLPLHPDQTERLFTGISEAMIANVYGGLAVGTAQGILTGLSFWALGLPAPILWTLVTGLASLVPVVGSALVWGPVSILLLLSGHWIKALILVGWGAAVVGQVDVVVRPYVVSARVKVHTLLVFFALLGGVEAFGIIGIFVGPVILSITLAVLDMLKTTNFSWQASHDNAEHITLDAKPTE
ncbi:MAG TPA: AI-2E family transporter [Terriglobales bacterium]|jgi:predicted PurR-regulated permease PerM|nr:AI-2E family transporter [Terriglobales bacterium]